MAIYIETTGDVLNIATGLTTNKYGEKITMTANARLTAIGIPANATDDQWYIYDTSDNLIDSGTIGDVNVVLESGVTYRIVTNKGTTSRAVYRTPQDVVGYPFIGSVMNWISASTGNVGSWNDETDFIKAIDSLTFVDVVNDAVEVGTGTSKEKYVKTKYPVESGTTAGTTKQTGMIMNLIPESSIVSNNERVGF